MLVGRDRELERVRRLLDDARGGRSGVLAIVGEAGIGKSALLDEAVRSADGVRLLRARGIQSERQIPFAGLFELLRPALECLDRIPAPRAEALESALGLRPGHLRDRFAVGAATLTLLAAYAEAQPLALLIDDAHWLDGSTADALLFAMRRLVVDPIAVLLSVRDGEPSLLDGADVPVLRLEGLDREGAAALLAPVTPELAERLHRETGGNPLALLELAAEPSQPLPLDAPSPVLTSVSGIYLRRAEALSEATREALVLAAATDRGDAALFVRAGGDIAALVPAEDAGLISLDGGLLAFRHPLARAAVYAGAPVEARRRAHRSLADALPDTDRDRRAWHLALSVTAPDDGVSSALEQAAIRAQERSASDVASHAFERAAWLAVSDGRRGHLLIAASDAAWSAGLAERTAELLDTAEQYVEGSDAGVELPDRRGQLALRRGPLDDARRLLHLAAEAAPPPRAAMILADSVYGAFYAGDGSWMQESADRARVLATRDDRAATTFYLSVVAGIANIFFGAGEAGASAMHAALSAHEATGELHDDPRAIFLAAVIPLWLREGDISRVAIEHAVAETSTRAGVGWLPQLLGHVAVVQTTRDRWVEAQATFDEAIALARETGQEVVLAGVLARLGLLEARLGREQACRAHVDEALPLARRLGAATCEVWALSALGELELALGDAAAAIARYEEMRALLAARAITDVDLSPAPEQVELLLRTGRSVDAVEIAAEYAGAAEAKGQPWARARAGRCRGLLADHDSFPDLFDEALALHRESPDAFEAARTELAYGARLRRAGRRSLAREHLRLAFAAFDELDAVPWAEQARTELAATGETARRRNPATLDELTPQELQVSLLLADGKTTKEAAASLFLSPKTIEYHLRNAYRKLAIHSREELREVLRARRAPSPEPSSAMQSARRL